MIGNQTRRQWLTRAFMWLGLSAAYGTLALQGWLFLLPKRIKPPTRRLFVGPTSSFEPESVKTVKDLRGQDVLIKRGAGGFRAFSSECPHLGCRVHWEEDKSRFFCPCHRGVFDKDGVAVSGPPADGGQDLFDVPLHVDEVSGVVYLEVPKRKRRA